MLSEEFHPDNSDRNGSGMPRIRTAELRHFGTKCDEDITPLHTPDTPPITPVVTQGPITRARARQLHQQVSSLLTFHTYNCEDGMLPNAIVDYIVIRNHGEGHGGLEEHPGCGGEQGGHAHQVGGRVQLDFKSNSESKTFVPSNRCPGCIRSPI
jgi:hypothetical protein